MQLDQLERWEAKTQDPARHAAVDLDTSIQEGQAIEIDPFADSDSGEPFGVGKQQWSPKSTFANVWPQKIKPSSARVTSRWNCILLLHWTRRFAHGNDPVSLK